MNIIHNTAHSHSPFLESPVLANAGLPWTSFRYCLPQKTEWQLSMSPIGALVVIPSCSLPTHSQVLNAAVLSRWSRSRPGLATSTAIPFRSRAFSCCRFSPPISSP
ncbi:hypothetical protein Vretimale_15656, partial [Volvox reticuliferus]